MVSSIAGAFLEATGGTDIPILMPKENPPDNYNQEGYYLIVAQAVVDYCGVFLDVNIDWPGKTRLINACEFCFLLKYQHAMNTIFLLV